MENAVSALKIAFAIFVFILGLAMLFSLSSQARETSSILITEADKTTYYEYYEGNEQSIDNNGNRVVRFEDIIPALYRYSEENYAVTIIDKDGNIVARFDLDTEANCNNWLSNTERDKFNRARFVNEIYKVFEEVNVLARKIGANQIKTNNLDKTNDCWTNITKTGEEITHAELRDNANSVMTDLFKKLYGQLNVSPTGRIRREYYCHWIRKCRMDSTEN